MQDYGNTTERKSDLLSATNKLCSEKTKVRLVLAERNEPDTFTLGFVSLIIKQDQNMQVKK